MKYIQSLDGVRAIAILLVMLFHFYYVLEIGWVGVQLFFVLSGYLITSILIETKHLNLKSFLKRFYWRRSLRIFPLYYGYLLAIVLLFLASGIPANMMETAPYLMSYTYNFYSLVGTLDYDIAFVHFWSLSVEEQFYLIWPLIIFFCPTNRLKHLLIGIIILSPFLRLAFGAYLGQMGVDSENVGQLVYRMTFSQFDAFAFGALIPVFKLTEAKIQPWIYKVIFATLAIVGGINYWFIQDLDHVGISSWGFPNGASSNYAHVWSYTLIDMAALAFIVWVLKNSKSFSTNRILSNQFMVNIGKYSYGLYVYHWVILAVFRKTLGPIIGQLPYFSTLISFVVYFAICYVVSWFSFKYFEAFFIGMKDKRFPMRIVKKNA